MGNSAHNTDGINGLPPAFLKRMGALLCDDAAVCALERALTREDRTHALRLMPGRDIQLQDLPWISPEDAVPWEQAAVLYPESETLRPGRKAYHEAGAYYIQEPSAMLPVALLDPKPGERILDLCAAPGGKSTQIAAHLGDTGLLVCNEVDPVRARTLTANLERMGVMQVLVVSMPPAVLAEYFEGYFDRILVDAPCSGEGLMRRNPEAVRQWDETLVDRCAQRQQEILDAAVRMLAPGGRLVYATCTFEREEDEAQIEALLVGYPGVFRPVPVTTVGASGTDPRRQPDGWQIMPGISADESVRCCCLRLWPHLVQGEGQFAAVLDRMDPLTDARAADSAGSVRRPFPVRTDTRLVRQGSTEQNVWEAFCREHLAETKSVELQAGNCIRFEDHLLMLPKEIPGLPVGLKLLCAGRRVGSVRRSGRGEIRFEPDHALAHMLCAGDMQEGRFVCLDPEGQEVGRYLAGESLRMGDARPGWVLVCAGRTGLGWAKSDGRTLKNHYPKGLRIT